MWYIQYYSAYHIQGEYCSTYSIIYSTYNMQGEYYRVHMYSMQGEHCGYVMCEMYSSTVHFLPCSRIQVI